MMPRLHCMLDGLNSIASPWPLILGQGPLPLFRVDESALGQLDPVTRLRVLLALSLILIAATFLLLFIRAGARWTRWYMQRPVRATRMPGDPFPAVIDGKPRVGSREAFHWRRRP